MTSPAIVREALEYILTYCEAREEDRSVAPLAGNSFLRIAARARAALAALDATPGEGETMRWKRIAQQSTRHIDALLLYATTYPTDSHALDAYVFLERLWSELGEKRTPRTETTFARHAAGRSVMPPFPPLPAAPLSGSEVK